MMYRNYGPKDYEKLIQELKLPDRIVKDSVYPDMYRIKLTDGSMSDMYNITRAKDHLKTVINYELELRRQKALEMPLEARTEV